VQTRVIPVQNRLILGQNPVLTSCFWLLGAKYSCQRSLLSLYTFQASHSQRNRPYMSTRCKKVQKGAIPAWNLLILDENPVLTSCFGLFGAKYGCQRFPYCLCIPSRHRTALLVAQTQQKKRVLTPKCRISWNARLAEMKGLAWFPRLFCGDQGFD
jgi:hypothetical protein